jgi:large conductance mechanosensitive channel
VTPAGDWRALKGGFWRFNWTYGNFLGTVVDFLIIGFVVFLVTKAFVRQAVPPPPAPTKTCPACREGIHPEATRCKFCTSEQPKPAAAG